jgi:hypothetical protein
VLDSDPELAIVVVPEDEFVRPNAERRHDGRHAAADDADLGQRARLVIEACVFYALHDASLGNADAKAVTSV